MEKLERIRKVGCPQLVVCINEQIASRAEVLRGCCDMELPSSSKRAAAIRRYNDQDPVRNGIRMDGKGDHQRVCEGERQHRSVGACAFLFRVLTIAFH